VQKEKITLWRKAPPRERTPVLETAVPSKARPLEAWSLSHCLEWLLIHYTPDGSLPCSFEEKDGVILSACPLCQQGPDTARLQAWIALIPALGSKPMLLALTARAVECCPALTASDTIRGLRLHVTRATDSPQSRQIVNVRDQQSYGTLPPCPPVRACVEAMYLKRQAKINMKRT
jgi:hypothetical protein